MSSYPLMMVFQTLQQESSSNSHETCFLSTPLSLSTHYTTFLTTESLQNHYRITTESLQNHSHDPINITVAQTMRFSRVPSPGTVSSCSRRSERSSGDSWQSWNSVSPHSANRGFKGDTNSAPCFDASEISLDHHDSCQTDDGGDRVSISNASRVSIKSVSAS